MSSPPFKCLFCLSTKGPFQRVEHPIPESLGNDELTLPPGFVCDPCNQYFGAKVENFVINAPPFGVERVRCDVKTKKGKHPHFKALPHIELHTTPFKNQVVLLASPDYWSFLQNSSHLLLPYSLTDDCLLARFLLKIGLGLLLSSNDCDPYSSQFDTARKYARSPASKALWQIGYGTYPFSEELVISEHEDEISSILTEQLYQYEIGVMANKEVVFSFMYRTHYFACNLSQPSIEEYTSSFNLLNEMKLSIINAKNI
ncbi:MAG: HNH endonuclease [Nostoc sp. ChiQUE02]|uniref:HNH endonuclease n=1 Tax=Nostoc sp. ChiQUE02 TaxID=3075377 RepID=UPI002AD49BAF|nr:HNH endonuclease [Nostoc sp. ChiQUE02]MDZ8231797.1 HNH endonuclease [Nostoc sp. ChiQUE02]